MKIITEPSVYLTGHQVLNQAELDRFLADHGVTWESDSDVAAEVLCETNGRLCYMSFAKPRPGGNAAYLHHIKEVGHGSVLEHAVWNLVITGVSRTLTHELVRHRAGWAYSQLSQRYVDESVAEYVLPDILKDEVEACRLWNAAEKDGRNPLLDSQSLLFMQRLRIGSAEFVKMAEAGEMWTGAVSHASASYVGLTDYLDKKVERRENADAYCKRMTKTDRRKFARQAARSVLPNATETKIAVTVNCRAARHFIEQRGSRHAEPEIRKLAYKVWQVLADHSPNLFGDYTAAELPDGTFELTTPFPKV